MPVSMTFECDGAGVLITASGNTEAVEFFKINETIYAPEVLAKLRYQLVDFTEVEQVDTSIEKIRKIAEDDKAAAEKTSGQLIAIVVNQEVIEGFANIYSGFASDALLQIKVFSTIKSAREWIDACLEKAISA